MHAAVGDHLEEAAAAVLVVEVLLQMRGEFLDAARQKSNLDLRAPCILLVNARIFDHLLFLPLRQHEATISQPAAFRK